jgi:hypothetical protein
MVVLGMQPQTSGYVHRNSDNYTTEAEYYITNDDKLFLTKSGMLTLIKVKKW